MHRIWPSNDIDDDDDNKKAMSPGPSTDIDRQTITKSFTSLARLCTQISHLKLYDALLTETEVHAFCVLHVEGTFVKLRDRIVSIQEGCLLVHLPDDQSGQSHTRHSTHQLHRCPVMDVAIPHVELFTLTLIVINCWNNISSDAIINHHKEENN